MGHSTCMVRVGVPKWSGQRPGATKGREGGDEVATGDGGRERCLTYTYPAAV